MPLAPSKLFCATARQKLAYRDQGNFLPLLVTSDAICPWVEHRFAVNQKKVVVMAVVQVNARAPGAIDMMGERMSLRVPIIEIADQKNRLTDCASPMYINDIGFEMLLAEYFG